MNAAQPVTTATTSSESPPQTQRRENAATRKARTRLWPDHSDDPIHYPSLAQRKLDLQDAVTEISLGRDSGRNMMAIFDDIDSTPRTKFNIRCKKGRSKTHWTRYHGVEDVDIPVGTTLKNMCQFYPFHCWGDGLRIFMAEGWTAEQMWKQLPRDARCDQARERPWNYLQQAMGREADIIYVEAGNSKRVPMKRKKDDTDNVAEGAVGDLGGNNARDVSRSPLSPQRSPGARSTGRSSHRTPPKNRATGIIPTTQYTLSPPKLHHPRQRTFDGPSYRGTPAPSCTLVQPTERSAGFDPMTVDPSILTPAEFPNVPQSQQQPAQQQHLFPYENSPTMQEIQYIQSLDNNAGRFAPQQHAARGPVRSTYPDLPTSQSQAWSEEDDGANLQGFFNGGQHIPNHPLRRTGGFDQPAFPSQPPAAGSMIGTSQQSNPIQPLPQAFVNNSQYGNVHLDFGAGQNFMQGEAVENAFPQGPFWQNDHFSGDEPRTVHPQYISNRMQHRNSQYFFADEAPTTGDAEMIDNGALSSSLTSSNGAASLPLSIGERRNNQDPMLPGDFQELEAMLNANISWRAS